MFETGRTLYEITGGREPFIFTFTVSEAIPTERGVLLPDKVIGRCEFTAEDCGVTVFDDYGEALKRIEESDDYEQYRNSRLSEQLIPKCKQSCRNAEQ